MNLSTKSQILSTKSQVLSTIRAHRIETYLHIIALVGTGQPYFRFVAVIDILRRNIQFGTGDLQLYPVCSLIGEYGNPFYGT